MSRTNTDPLISLPTPLLSHETLPLSWLLLFIHMLNKLHSSDQKLKIVFIWGSQRGTDRIYTHDAHTEYNISLFTWAVVLCSWNWYLQSGVRRRGMILNVVLSSFLVEEAGVHQFLQEKLHISQLRILNICSVLVKTINFVSFTIFDW